MEEGGVGLDEQLDVSKHASIASIEISSFPPGPVHDEEVAKPIAPISGQAAEEPNSSHERKAKHGEAVEKEANELLAVVKLIQSVVTCIVEAFVDMTLFMLCLIPLLVPWRTLDVLQATVPDRSDPGWRKEYRKRASFQLIFALGDLCLVPMVLLVLPVPTRALPIIEAVLHRHEIQYTDVGFWAKGAASIRYKKDLRLHFAAQFIGGILDIGCLVPLAVVLALPWRAAAFASNSVYILKRVAPIETAYTPENFVPGEGLSRWMVTFEEVRGILIKHAIGGLFDIPVFTLGIVSMAIPTRTWPLIVEVVRVFHRPVPHVYGLNEENTMTIVDWTGLHVLCGLNFVYAMLDIVVIAMVPVLLATVVRAVPFLANAEQNWANSPRIIKVVIPNRVIGGGKISRFSLSRTAADVLDAPTAMGEALVISRNVMSVRTSIITSLASIDALAGEDLAAGEKRPEVPLPVAPAPSLREQDPFESRSSTTSAAAPRPDFASTTANVGGARDPDAEFQLSEELNGSYMMSGMRRGNPYYRLMVHNLAQDSPTDTSPIVPARRPAFLGMWDDTWYMCLTQDPRTAVVRWSAKNEDRDPAQAFFLCREGASDMGVAMYKWEYRKCCAASEEDPSTLGEDEWVSEHSTSVIIGNAMSDSLSYFGKRHYNIGLRMLVLRNVGWLVLDIFFFPFFLLLLLTGYRFPPVVRMMRRDVESDVGRALGFNPSVADTSLLGSTWAGHLGYGFGWSSRREVLRQTGFVLLDILLLPVYLIILLTFYRLKALRGHFQYFSIWWHFLVLLQLNVLFADVFLAVPVLIVAMTGYRFKVLYNVSQAETGSWIVSGVDLTLRFEVLRQCAFVFLDLLVLPFTLPVLVTVYRLRYLRGTFNPRNANFHRAVLWSCLYILHDLFLVIAVLVCCLIPFPRLFLVMVAMKGDIPHWYGRQADPQMRVREEIYSQCILGLQDMATAPAFLLVFLTRYRWCYVQPHVKTSVRLREFDPHNEERSSNLHKQAWMECGLVLHDMLLLWPACLVLLVTYYRSAAVFEMARSSMEMMEDVMSLEQDSASIEGPLTAGLRLEEQTEQAAIQRTQQLADRFDVDEEGAGEQVQVPEAELPEAAPIINPREAEAQEYQRFMEGEAERRQRQELRPERWQRITTNLIQADHAWAEFVNWNEAPLANEGPSLRWNIWVQFAGFLIDLPFLFMGFLVCLLVWRASALRSQFHMREDARSRRLAVCLELLLTFRDLLILPLFVLLIATPRAPKVLMHLCCRRSSKNPLRTPPLMTTTKIEGILPVKGQVTLKISGDMATNVEGAFRRNSLYLQIVAEPFWEDLARTFGNTKTGLMRLMMPVRVGKSNTDFADVLEHARAPQAVPEDGLNVGGDHVEFSVTFPLTVERSSIASVINKLRLETWLTIQLEAATTSGKPQVVASFPLQISDFVATVANGSMSVEDPRLTDEFRRQTCLESQRTKNTAEIFAGLVCLEFFEFLVDLLHLVAILFSFLAPWRLFQLLSSLHEPKGAWTAEMCRAAETEMDDLKASLKTLRGELLPLVNSMAKDPEMFNAWCNPAFNRKNDRLPLEVKEYTSNALREHRWLEQSLRSKNSDVPPHLAAKINTWLEMQDARLYYMTLRSYANCLLSAGRLTIEEHGLIIMTARNAEVDFTRATGALNEEIAAGIRETFEQAVNDTRESFGVCHKDARMVRQIIERRAGDALGDLLGGSEAFLVLLTVYRIPRFILEARAAGWPWPTSGRFKALAARHFRAIFSDLNLALQIVALWLGCLITLVRFIEVFSEAFAVRQTLRSLRDLLLRHLKESVLEIWQLFSMVVFIKFGKLALTCVLQLLLVPPACLHELITRIVGHRLPLVLRFTGSIVIFYFILLLPVILRDSLAAPALRLLYVLLLFTLSAANAASVARNKAYTDIGEDSTPTLNVTWGNAISVLAVLTSPASLVWLLVGRHSTHYATPVDCNSATDVGITATVFTVLWLIIVSWMFLSHGDIVQGNTRNPFIVVLQLVMSHLMFLPLIISLCGHGMGRCEETGSQTDNTLPGFQCLLLAVLAVYLVTTQMLASANAQAHLSSGGNVDARYATLYIMVSQMAEFVAVAVPAGMGSKGLDLALPAVTCLCEAVWTMLYERLLGSPACPIRHLEAMRVGANLAVPWTVICLLLEGPLGAEGGGFLALWLVGLGLLGAFTADAVRRIKGK